jgi:HAD superfamily hydrolase (TIGR01484 family)
MPTNTTNKLSDLKIDTLKYFFTDIDDTLTEEGKLKSNAYSALWRLYDSGIKVIPVTGRPAGWCEMILRTWPVEAVIGENGGFYFSFSNCKSNAQINHDSKSKNDSETQTVHREFWMTEAEQKENRIKLNKIQDEVFKTVKGAGLASDQFCRLMDLAIDFKEDVLELSKVEIDKIVEVFKSHGAQAKISSIHVNGWFGDYNKSKMIKKFCKTHLKKDFSDINEQAVFIGDSPNDEENFSMFRRHDWQA